MKVQELAAEYRQNSDEELLRLALEQDQLTEEARVAFQAEMAARRLSSDHVERYRSEDERIRKKERGKAQGTPEVPGDER